ncbi:MAG: hypothetical protein HRU41_15185 [Saprospiraceae bacterium]|nr:hypothetical protein [Saprospiraceae bacterium]
MKICLPYLLVFAVFLLACEKQNVQQSVITPDSSLTGLLTERAAAGEKDEGGKGEYKEDKACFDLVYPLGITMPDGSTLSGEEAVLWEAVKAWYDANPDSKDKPSLIYPIEIEWVGKEVVKTIENEKGLEEAFEYCKGDKDPEDCFEWVYPLTWLMPDGSTITIEEKEDWEALKSWYDANPNAEAKPELSYPVSIESKDGTIRTVQNDDEMENAKADCD